MNDRPSVGLLPLYLKLYDDSLPSLRAQFEPFVHTIVSRLEQAGVVVAQAGPCRLQSEVQQAVRSFEDADADLIITLHLAYSPSLESAHVLAQSSLPVLMLDTTMDPAFGPDVDPERLMFNHGIHGVQDLASVLRREGKPFRIVAGHVTDSDVLARTAATARAAHAARRLRTMRVLRIGETFAGMGDFAVADPLLHEALGVSVDQLGIEAIAAEVQRLSPHEIQEEIERDRTRFDVAADEDAHRRSVRVGLGLRRLLERGGYGAFSMNFTAFDSADGPVDTVPFLEACKAMGRGLGYAGEGDALTAALVGAINSAFGRTTFTEIFCPDWKGGTLFLSHMGEINPETSAGRPRLCTRPFPWTPARDPVIAACAPAPGPALLANLAPQKMKMGTVTIFSLIVSPVEVVSDEGGVRSLHPGYRDWVRGWIRPSIALEPFLEGYSRLGGTHHSALVLGERTEALVAFAEFAGLPCSVL